MNIFDYYTELTDGSLDVYKKIDISDIQETANYIYHDIKENENLMSISQIYYNTKDDWWILYLFNNIYDINFYNLNDSITKRSTDTYINNLLTYNNLPELDKAKVRDNLLTYFLDSNTLKDSISLMNLAIETPNSYVDGYKGWMLNILVQNSFFVDKLKIPNTDIVYAIKNRMDTYSIEWNT